MIVNLGNKTIQLTITFHTVEDCPIECLSDHFDVGDISVLFFFFFR